MKKFLPIVLALALMIPATEVFAAIYIPSFYDITSNSVKKRIDFQGMQEKSHNGMKYTQWTYEVLDGKTSEYVSKYVRRFSSSPLYTLVGQDGSNWYFTSKKAQSRNIRMLDNAFHFHVGVSGDYVIVNCASGVIPSTN